MSTTSLEKMKEELRDHFEEKKKEEFGRSLFEKFSDLYKQHLDPLTITPVQKFPDLREEVTNAAAEEEIKSLEAEILKDASDDIKITAIKQDIEAERAGIRTMCEASKIYMPQTYRFLEAYTASEFKRVMLVHKYLGIWLEFPTIGELGRNDPEVKKYFKTYLHLLEDRGIEQDKQFHYKPEEFLFLNKDGDNKLPHQLQRVLDEDEEHENYNEPLEIQTLELTVSSLPASGAMTIDALTMEMKIFNGTKWETIP
jgi:hypothetical protein